MIAYPYPTVDNEIISSAADMGNGVKKQTNAVKLSGKEKHKRDLHLNGLPVQLRMAYDVYKESSDYKTEGTITLFPKLGVDVFEKTSKSRMRFALAARAMGSTIAKCIRSHHLLVKKASPRTFDSYLEVCEKTDRFLDILNGNYKKGCTSIDSPNHPLLFELLDYVKWLKKRRNQSLLAKKQICVLR